MADEDHKAGAKQAGIGETKQAAEEEVYVVGPGRPPKDNRFKKGVSGNPKGRPKGSVSMAALIQKESLRKVPVTEGGRTKSMSKMNIVARQITQGAMKGDPKATAIFIQELAKINDVGAANGPAAAVPDLDLATMRRIAERVLRDVEELEAEQRQ
jgi:hypothetical protein